MIIIIIIINIGGYNFSEKKTVDQIYHLCYETHKTSDLLFRMQDSYANFDPEMELIHSHHVNKNYCWIVTTSLVVEALVR